MATGCSSSATSTSSTRTPSRAGGAVAPVVGAEGAAVVPVEPPGADVGVDDGPDDVADDAGT